MEIGVQSNVFERITPMTYSVLKIQNKAAVNRILHADYLRVAVLDSTHNNQPPIVAAIVVPRNRENDWLFSTEAGHIELMEKYFHLSRLFLVGNHPNDSYNFNYNLVEETEDDKTCVKEYVQALLQPLTPLILVGAETRFIKFFDGLVSRITVSVNSMNPLGLFAVTDEHVLINGELQWRRRLRWEKTGDRIHAEIGLMQIDSKGNVIPVDPNDKRDVLHQVDLNEMVDSCWNAMKFGIESFFSQKESKQRKALSLGSIGGAFLNILSTVSSLGLEVVSVAENVTFSDLILGGFGTTRSPVETYVADPMEILQMYHVTQPSVIIKLADFHNKNYGRFDVLVVNLKSFGSRLCAPGREMITIDCLQMMRSAVTEDGVLVMHVIPFDYLSYTDVLFNVKEVFERVWKISINGEKEFVIVATMDSTWTGGDATKKMEEILV